MPTHLLEGMTQIALHPPTTFQETKFGASSI